MTVHTLTVGDMGTNAYLVAGDDKTAAIIDPGGDGDRLLREVSRHALTVKAILLTHTHEDHIAALEQVRRATGAPIYVHQDDACGLTDPEYNLSIMLSGMPLPPIRNAVLLEEGDEVLVGAMTFRTLHTPGHTKGSVCFACEDCLFTGDTLFRESIGRTCYPSGSLPILLQSVNRLMQMEGDYAVLQGHGAPSTLNHERQENPFVNGTF